MPVITVGDGSKIYLADDAAVTRLADLSSRSESSLSDLDRQELGALRVWQQREQHTRSLALNPNATVPGYDQLAAGQGQSRSDWSKEPASRLNPIMGRHPETMIGGARAHVERAHSRSALPDHAATLLDRSLAAGPLHERAEFANYLLSTGDEAYQRALAKLLLDPSAHMTMSNEERDAVARAKDAARAGARALAMGTPASWAGGSYPVPYQLDPTVILNSSGVINPLRQISRVEQIVGKEWLGVASAGVTVTRELEGSEENDAAPTLSQPGVAPTRVSAFVPFSVEVEQDWDGLLASLTSLIADAKDVEEASSFALGDGTAPNPAGVISSLGTASISSTAATASVTLADVQALEGALAPRFRAGSSYLLNSGMIAALRRMQMVTGTPALVGQQDGVMTLAGRDARLLTVMDDGVTFAEGGSGIGISTAVGVSGHQVVLLGDFRQFVIVDRIGMSIELVPHLFGTARNMPTGQRGLFAMWRNGSAVLSQNAFRLLQVK